MNTQIGKNYLIKDDFENYPIWKFDEEDDLFYKVTKPEEFPEDDYDLMLRARFITNISNIELTGYIVGIKNIFSITVFLDDEILRFNKNLPDRCLLGLEKLGKILGKKITIDDFSPIKYTTTIDIEGYRNISGEFDLSKEQMDAERLGDLWTGD